MVQDTWDRRSAFTGLDGGGPPNPNRRAFLKLALSATVVIGSGIALSQIGLPSAGQAAQPSTGSGGGGGTLGSTMSNQLSASQLSSQLSMAQTQLGGAYQWMAGHTQPSFWARSDGASLILQGANGNTVSVPWAEVGTLIPEREAGQEEWDEEWGIGEDIPIPPAFENFINQLDLDGNGGGNPYIHLDPNNMPPRLQPKDVVRLIGLTIARKAQQTMEDGCLRHIGFSWGDNAAGILEIGRDFSTVRARTTFLAANVTPGAGVARRAFVPVTAFGTVSNPDLQDGHIIARALQNPGDDYPFSSPDVDRDTMQNLSGPYSPVNKAYQSALANAAQWVLMEAELLSKSNQGTNVTLVGVPVHLTGCEALHNDVPLVSYDRNGTQYTSGTVSKYQVPTGFIYLAFESPSQAMSPGDIINNDPTFIPDDAVVTLYAFLNRPGTLVANESLKTAARRELGFTKVQIARSPGQSMAQVVNQAIAQAQNDLNTRANETAEAIDGIVDVLAARSSVTDLAQAFGLEVPAPAEQVADVSSRRSFLSFAQSRSQLGNEVQQLAELVASNETLATAYAMVNSAIQSRDVTDRVVAMRAREVDKQLTAMLAEEQGMGIV